MYETLRGMTDQGQSEFFAKRNSDDKRALDLGNAARVVAYVACEATRLDRMSARNVAVAINSLSPEGRAAAWAATRADCEAMERGENAMQSPLWRGAPYSENRLREGISGFAGGFWRAWYQGYLDGQPLDWEFQNQVALIPDEDWKKGPDHIARLVEELEAAYLAEKLPQAERVEFNPATGRFRLIPTPLAKPALIAATISQVSDALSDALANPSNGLSEGSREARVISRMVTKYGNDPQRIEMDLTNIHRALTRQIATEDLPPSEENLALQAACEEGAQAVRATHPEVAENRLILSEHALREFKPDEKFSEYLPVLAAASEEELAEQFNEDIPELINDAFGQAPNNALRLPGADPATRIFSRTAKMSIVLRKSTDALDAICARTGLSRGDLLNVFMWFVGMGITLFS
ncbi:hypothetical protein [Allgaiera indica]|uniref:hypothetical protein n=1 Tax=Allgaiera indica TaxID=765699 RepID=UPI00115FF265|nr:hypothetical protein [Allgaiera indica]